jgi:hypothetical protein
MLTFLHTARSYSLILVVVVGCIAGREELQSVAPGEWTKEECMTVILSSVATNIFDHRYNVKIIALPYFPSVVEAITRLADARDTMNDFEGKYKYQMDALLKSGSGLYYDWDKAKYYSPRGHYYSGKLDLDSLLFLVTLLNTGWPCLSPIILDRERGTSHTLFSLADTPCDTPAISNIENQIKLVNDRGDTLSPRYVFGRKHDQLTSEEDLFVMFHMDTADQGHFLDKTDNIRFVITLTGVKLSMPISLRFVD